LVNGQSQTLKETRIDRKPQSEAVVSDGISTEDRLELAYRMNAYAKTWEDQAETVFTWTRDVKK
ncbi:MAG: hypothetical protein Q9175_006350, partial [Cornicularia normoerica]